MPALFKIITLAVCSTVFTLSGCSVVNFSAHYYNPPPEYRIEVASLWQNIQAQTALKYSYQVRIIDGADSDRLNGVPAISNQMILLPDDFVKYVYQNYYDDRIKIFSSVMVHEISHVEFDLPSRPAEQHFKTDVAAIKILGGDEQAALSYYKSLRVMKDYWFARKGMGGHALNAGWNALNMVSLVNGGPAAFADFYATDLDRRMSLIRKKYKMKSGVRFGRSGYCKNFMNK